MELTYDHLRNMVDIYNTPHRHGFKNWYAFIESIGIGERYSDTDSDHVCIHILDPHLFTVACIRYGI